MEGCWSGPEVDQAVALGGPAAQFGFAGGVRRGAAPEGDHARSEDAGVVEGSAFGSAEGGEAVGLEGFGGGGVAEDGGGDVVEVDEGETDGRGHEPTDGGFAAATEPEEVDGHRRG